MGSSPLLSPMFWNLSCPGLGSTLPLVLTMLPGTVPLMVFVHSLMGVFFLLVTRVSPWLRLFVAFADFRCDFRASNLGLVSLGQHVFDKGVVPVGSSSLVLLESHGSPCWKLCD